MKNRRSPSKHFYDGVGTVYVEKNIPALRVDRTQIVFCGHVGKGLESTRQRRPRASWSRAATVEEHVRGLIQLPVQHG